MNTLGNKTNVSVTCEESYSLNFGFVASAIVPKGAIVALNATTGQVEVAGAANAFGIVTVGNKAIGEKVTVQTQFNTEVIGQADGTVAIGDVLTTTGLDATTQRTKYKKAVAGNVAVAIALGAAATTEDVKVGVLRVFQTVGA